MNQLFTFFKMSFLIIMMYHVPLNGSPCNLSSLNMVGMTVDNNGDYIIDLELCAGGGYGGANQQTATFAFIIYGGANVIAAPTFISSPQTPAVNQLLAMDNDTLIYLNSGPDYYTCINYICGGPQAFCTTIQLVTDALPSSIFLIGMEGAGNPWAGCLGQNMYVYPDPNFQPAPCEFTYLYASAGTNKTVYLGYTPRECVSITGTGSGEYAAPLSYSWNTGQTTRSISVCPQVTTTYTVTITDADGCYESDDVTVFVNDIRCGSNLDKVLLCDTKGNTKCENESKVAGKLAKGWRLGPCYNNTNNRLAEDVVFSEDPIRAYPTNFDNNLNLELNFTDEKVVNIRMIDLQGKILKDIYNGMVPVSKKYQTSINTSDIGAGFYLIQAITDQSNIEVVKVIKSQ